MTDYDCLQTAREKERRKRKPGPLLLAGFCLPKALQPVLPIYLQGMLQVCDLSSFPVSHRHAHALDLIRQAQLLAPSWHMLRALQGSSGELREIAAEGLGELVEVTSQESLRPFTVQITGEGHSDALMRHLTPASAAWQQDDQHEFLRTVTARWTWLNGLRRLQGHSSASSATASPGRSRRPSCTPWACSLARLARA